MSLWIRSQDKRFLIECNDVAILKTTDGFKIGTCSIKSVKREIDLGTYSTKEKALKLRDDLCNALVGIPGFVNNEIIVNTQDIDKETLQPLNEEGNMVIVDKDGEKHEHCVRLIIDSDKQSHEIPNRIIFCKGAV